MFTGRLLRSGVWYALLFGMVFMSLFVLAACDATGGVGGATPTAGRPTSTVAPVNTRPPRVPPTATLEEFFPQDPTEVVDEPTATPRQRATSTPVEEPTEIIEEPTEVIEEPTEVIEEPTEIVEEPTAVVSGDYTYYEAPEGGWTIEYPTGWMVNEAPPNYQFLEPNGEAFIQVTYSVGTSGMTHEELAQSVSDQFSKSFDDYVESGMEEQSDGSYRIDFKFSVNGIDWDAQVFVEGRNDQLYMLLLATTEEAFQAGTYDDIITYVIGSYTVPK
jgi:hypothetical protein